jgi:hypothetical protein
MTKEKKKFGSTVFTTLGIKTGEEDLLSLRTEGIATLI